MRAIEWTGETLRVLDQRLLPHEQVWVDCRSAADVADAIVRMLVRGAPAIGATAAYGVALEAARKQHLAPAEFHEHMSAALQLLAGTRPTAVNLFWAIEKMRQILAQDDADPRSLTGLLRREAESIAEQDILTNRRIGAHGESLFANGAKVLTHCNTGSLATVEYGTALGVIRALQEAGKLEQVWVDETRPYLQGARLTAYELSEENIPYRLITDSMAGYFMSRGEVDAVIVGADRIAANGDTANKIGTYSLAVLCHFHGIPFYVAAPVTTFDVSIQTGADIPIEERSGEEVTSWFGKPVAPLNAAVRNPAFDVTPADLITAIITELGVIERPSKAAVDRVLGGEVC